jgi:ABC-type glycerol-3-phosphate transport system substrate-binding protein
LSGRLAQQRVFDWDVAPLPHGQEWATLLEVVGYSISSQSQRPDEAWKLLSFLTRETSQAALVQQGGYAPAVRSLLASKLFLDFPGPTPIANTVFTKSLPFARMPPRSREWILASRIFSEEMSSLMVYPKMSVRTALEPMQGRLEELSLLLRQHIRK